jgi:hypothetical protein
MSNRWNKKNKQNKVIYTILNVTENTKERDCISADKKNEKKYRETIEKLGNTTKVWENTGVMFNMEVPPPPKPNNYDRLLDYRKKNVLRPAIKQSEATIYLFQRGYIMGQDYEAFQAIEVVKKLQAYEYNLSLETPEELYVQKKIKEKKTSNSIRRRIKKPEVDRQVRDVDLSMLNLSENIEKKRHSIIIPNSKNNSTEKEKLKRKSASFYKTIRKKAEPILSPINNNNNNSNSSIDSLFDEDELKQFEKNYENDERKKRFTTNVENFEYLTQQEKYNGIYPRLDNLVSPDFCSV